MTAVRRATVADAAAIARVHVASWREAYAEAMPADFLASLDEQQRAEAWSPMLTDGRTDAFVAERDGEIVGWATASVGRDGATSTHLIAGTPLPTVRLTR